MVTFSRTDIFCMQYSNSPFIYNTENLGIMPFSFVQEMQSQLLSLMYIFSWTVEVFENRESKRLLPNI